MPEKLSTGKHGATSDDEIPEGGIWKAGLFGVWLPGTVNAPCLPAAQRSGHRSVRDKGAAAKLARAPCTETILQPGQAGRQAGSALDVVACWNEGTEHSLNYR